MFPDAVCFCFFKYLHRWKKEKGKRKEETGWGGEGKGRGGKGGKGREGYDAKAAIVRVSCTFIIKHKKTGSFFLSLAWPFILIPHPISLFSPSVYPGDFKSTTGWILQQTVITCTKMKCLQSFRGLWKHFSENSHFSTIRPLINFWNQILSHWT